MKIENIDVEKLKPYDKNAKKHPKEQVEHIANSIREFGFQHLVIDGLALTQYNYLIGGNYMAVRKSKNIGRILNGYLILDSRRHKNDTQYYVKCQNVGLKHGKAEVL